MYNRFEKSALRHINIIFFTIEWCPTLYEGYDVTFSTTHCVFEVFQCTYWNTCPPINDDNI